MTLVVSLPKVLYKPDVKRNNFTYHEYVYDLLNKYSKSMLEGICA